MTQKLKVYKMKQFSMFSFNRYKYVLQTKSSARLNNSKGLDYNVP